MIDGIFQKKQRRHVQDLNIVPILDMLTTVIFFLLLSTSFMEFTKHTVPPSATASVSEAAAEPPLSPKILLHGKKGARKLLLRWGGKNPGEESAVIPGNTETKEGRDALLKASEEMIRKFSTAHPDEKTIQVALASGLPYQDLISVMDGVRPSLPDVVLISYHEADAIGRNQEAEGK